MVIKTNEPDQFGSTKKGILLHMDEDPIYSWSEAWTKATPPKFAKSSKSSHNTKTSEEADGELESLPVD